MKKIVTLLSILIGLGLLAAPPASAEDVTACAVDLETDTYACGGAASRMASGRVHVLRLTGSNGIHVINFYKTACTAEYWPAERLIDLRTIPYGSTGKHWDDKMETIETFNRCDIRLHDDPDYNVTMSPSSWVDRDMDMVIGGRNWWHQPDSFYIS